jgi:hypothetical protein
MPYNYRARIQNVTPAGDGTLHFDTYIEMEVETDVWQVCPMGHRTLVLQASAVSAITENDQLTDNEKRSQLRDLFKQQAQGWGIDEADSALNDIVGLIPGENWPVNVGLN